MNDYPYITLLAGEGSRNLLYQVALSPDLSLTVSDREALAKARELAMDLREREAQFYAS